MISILGLTGCTPSGRVDVSRQLPAAPACMAPVAVPPLAKGQDAREALARSRGALGKANGNLRCSRGWYEKVRGTVRK